MAGRIHTVEAGTLSLTEIGELRHLNHPDPFLPDNGLGHLSHVGFWQELADGGVQPKSTNFATVCMTSTLPSGDTTLKACAHL